MPEIVEWCYSLWSGQDSVSSTWSFLSVSNAFRSQAMMFEVRVDIYMGSSSETMFEESKTCRVFMFTSRHSFTFPTISVLG